MNLMRGFKRIIHVLALVIAVVCGIVAGSKPVQKYHYARTNWWYLDAPLVIRPPTEEDLVDFEKWQQDNKVIIDANSYVIDPHSSSEQTLMTVCNNYFENQRRKFWYNLPTAKLTGIVVLYGLGGAVAGYVGTWVTLWYGGLAIFILISWLILGFADEKPKDK
ncbi:MAG: hypothetical protein PVH77_11865 [Phycisphaerales bacterium]|jgi:hypothetical protein